MASCKNVLSVTLPHRQRLRDKRKRFINCNTTRETVHFDEQVHTYKLDEDILLFPKEKLIST